jgi:AcrR family transcriptional regulator
MQDMDSKQLPQRQARGQKRIAELLRAAGEVFEEVGYERATTNAIAAKAGVSPGTLYQFFSNKQEIAEALANWYTAQGEAIHAGAFGVEPGTVTLPQLLDRTVDPFLEFRQNAPGYDALFIGMMSSPELAVRVRSLHEGLKKRLATLMAPHIPHAQRDGERCAEICVHIFKGLLPLALQGTPQERKLGAQAIKDVLAGYLLPIIESGKKSKKARSKVKGD